MTVLSRRSSNAPSASPPRLRPYPSSLLATELLRSLQDIRTIQELLGHEDLRTTRIYTHVAKFGTRGITSPLPHPPLPDEFYRPAHLPRPHPSPPHNASVPPFPPRYTDRLYGHPRPTQNPNSKFSRETMRREPSDMMTEGATHIASVLAPLGFTYRVVGTGASSGGSFCEAEFAGEGKRLELHFRHALGLVRWHIGDTRASHGAYMEALGRRASYPQSQDDEMEGFRCLLRDFSLIRTDFIDGDGGVLAKAAEAEEAESASRNRELMVGYVGDTVSRSQARAAFRSEDYAGVVRLLSSIRYPDEMTLAEKNMYAMARKRVNPG